MADGYAINGNYDTVHWRDGMIMIGNRRNTKIYFDGKRIATVPYYIYSVAVAGDCALTFDVMEGQP
jgi:hypothetical protein